MDRKETNTVRCVKCDGVGSVAGPPVVRGGHTYPKCSITCTVCGGRGRVSPSAPSMDPARRASGEKDEDVDTFPQHDGVPGQS